MTSTHGTRYEEQAGRLTAIIDRTGHAWALLAWDGDRLAELRVPGAGAARGAAGAGGPEAPAVIVDGAIVRDPLLGDAHAIRAGDPEPRVLERRSAPDSRAGDAGEAIDRDVSEPGPTRPPALTMMSALDWRRPTEIPTVAAPGRLPPGAGGALLHAIAVLAARAGVPALRYAGPYPTPALWRALGRSFRTSGTEAAFTAELYPRAARLARDPIEIDFAPAPCERVAFPGGHAELRDGIERAVVDGTAYEPGGSPARLVPDGDHARAELWIGDAPYAHVATIGPDGSLVDGPRAIPPCESRVIGAEFPPPLVLALAELVAQAVPAPLAQDARAWMATRPIRWADLGARVAVAQGDELCVHAALWERIAPLGLGRLALALAEALAPTAAAAVIAAVLEAPPRA